MSLKLRLNLIITILLLIMLLVGMLLNVVNARQNVRAEVESTEKLALYLFDMNKLGNSAKPANDKPFRLQSLQHMRHVRIEFYDVSGSLLDSNQGNDARRGKERAPTWFESVMNAVTPQWESQIREVQHDGIRLGQLKITPDPSFEYAEIWKQITDFFMLLAVFFVAVNAMVSWAVGQALKPTDRILKALEDLESGNLRARLPGFDLPELARIGEKFNLMVENLEQSISRNHRLSQQLITLQEAERKSLARDLHDEFGQCLTAIHADSAVLLKLSERYPEIRDSANAVNTLSRHLMDLVSGLLQKLRPGVLDELGLVAALQDLVQTWQSRFDGLDCKLELADDIPVNLSEPLQVAIYRAAQECLTNVSRHSQATEVLISIAREAKQGLPAGLRICVEDNGLGFEPADAEGFGLPGMRERVEGLGGRMTIDSARGKGTRILIWIPLRQGSILQ